jgi:adenosylcobinamide-GDP ribazoletransferase
VTLQAWRLIVGTLTMLPVTPPSRVDRVVARRAATLAPGVGGLLALLVAPPAWLFSRFGTPLVAAALCIAVIAALTRAIHLDGLADTADGLGSGRDRATSLAIMRQSDIGPFGVVTVTLALLIQVAALAACFTAGAGLVSLAVGLILSRAVLPRLCSHPAARPDGLGSTFAGSTGGTVAIGTVVLATALSAAIIAGHQWLAPAAAISDGRLWSQLIFQPVALLPLWRLERVAMSRLGGMSGDVYGAGIEISFTASLVVSAMVVSS